MNTNESTSEGEDSNGREVMDILRENLNTVVIAGIYGILLVSGTCGTFLILISTDYCYNSCYCSLGVEEEEVE